jgi:hypothetical protein
MPDPGRTPPRATLRALRQEVGFCCPVLGCGSPYLTWHHFDPPWRVEHHHRPEGMIALCREHADQADNDAFTDDQLRELKRVGKARAQEVRGRFNWMRQDLLAVVGGNFYYRQPVIFEIGNVRCIWFDRDDEGYLLLNFRMPTIAGRPRAEIERNSWMVSPAVNEVVCPPSGRLVEVSYHNGDKFRAEFFNIASPGDFESRYPEVKARPWLREIEFPLTVAELWETAAETPIEFGPTFSRVPRWMSSGGFFRENNGAAIHLSASEAELALLFPEENKTYVQRDVYLTDLLDKREQPPRLEGFTFTQCRVYGPIVVYPFGAPNVFNHCHFHSSTDAMLYEVPGDSFRIGCVPLIACRFTDCEIENVGIMGTSEQLTVFRQSPE